MIELSKNFKKSFMNKQKIYKSRLNNSKNYALMPSQLFLSCYLVL